MAGYCHFSYLQPDVSARLADLGILVVNRSNIGLCIGAYRDISVLFGSNQLFDRVSSFVLMNDSCLLLKHPLSLLDHINTMHNDFHNDSPTWLVLLILLSEVNIIYNPFSLCQSISPTTSCMVSFLVKLKY